MKSKKVLIAGIAVITLAAVVGVLYLFNIIPHKSYSNAHFHIDTYTSAQDADMDGIDDQTDILKSAYAYVDTKPKYKSAYYNGGYPDDGYGVCTDVVAQGMLGAGYDLQKLVAEDIARHPEDYAIDEADSNIDFRRVKNLKVYFEHTAICLTTDPEQISEWQGGDIVIFKGHIAIVSDRRNSDGIPFIIHHANPLQMHYLEDAMLLCGDILGHYRIS